MGRVDVWLGQNYLYGYERKVDFRPTRHHGHPPDPNISLDPILVQANISPDLISVQANLRVGWVSGQAKNLYRYEWKVDFCPPDTHATLILPQTLFRL